MPSCRACRHAVHSSCRLTVVSDRVSEPSGSLKACGSSLRCCIEMRASLEFHASLQSDSRLLYDMPDYAALKGKCQYILNLPASSQSSNQKHGRYRRRQLKLSARNAGSLGFSVGAILALMHEDLTLPGSWIERPDRTLEYPQCLAKVTS
jgi:hypothetical protein